MFYLQPLPNISLSPLLPYYSTPLLITPMLPDLILKGEALNHNFR
ncbi:MAG: hypothetical protein SWX82_22370 [Cyanobacteriota bacterium]|nr:hypothetical protein [Cyanobacteriota bacterium]